MTLRAFISDDWHKELQQDFTLTCVEPVMKCQGQRDAHTDDITEAVYYM